MLVLPRSDALAGVLAFLFIQKLEPHGALEPGEARRIWAEIAGELQNQSGGRELATHCLAAIDAYGLAKE
ncbi:MAG TPA: hypothetical protein VKZ79_02225 [Alphaproteobacteria bacterium]|nr:hypothetical protein [Alphaproteobacteria bacterium]